MDYDDNDFSNHNFHLVGDDNGKCPSVLRTFLLPKFNLDEHLEDNVFDTSIETDCLLGVPVQENVWTNNFAPVTSRHKNVWSEATSSESVEMLLKSVSEEDTMNEKVTGNKFNEQSHFECQMSSYSEQEDPFTSKIEDVVQVDLDPLPDKCEAHFSTMVKDSVDSQHLEDMPQPGSGISSIHETLDSNHETSSGSKNEITASPGTANKKDMLHESLLQTVHKESPLRSDTFKISICDDLKTLSENPQENPNILVAEVHSLPMPESNFSQLTEVGRSEFPGNPDGLLEGIAYPEKLWNKNNFEGNKIETWSKQSVEAGDTIAIHVKKPNIMDSSELTQTIEQFEISGCDQSEASSENRCHGESTPLVENVGHVAAHADDMKVDYVEVIDKKIEDETSKFQGNNNYLENASMEVIAVDSATELIYQSITAETNDDGSKIELFNSTPSSLGTPVVKKHSEDEAEISTCLSKYDILDKSLISSSKSSTVLPAVTVAIKSDCNASIGLEKMSGVLETVQTTEFTGLDHSSTENINHVDAGKENADSPFLTRPDPVMTSPGIKNQKQLYSAVSSTAVDSPDLQTAKSNLSKSDVTLSKAKLAKMENASLSSALPTCLHEEDIKTSTMEDNPSAETSELTTLPHDSSGITPIFLLRIPVSNDKSPCSNASSDDNIGVDMSGATLDNSEVIGSPMSVENAAALESCLIQTKESVDLPKVNVTAYMVPSNDYDDQSHIQKSEEEIDVESNVLDARSGSSGYEPNCGSPTVISCIEVLHDEVDYSISKTRLDVQSSCIVDRGRDHKDQSEHDMDGRIDDDTNFTFQVESIADISGKSMEDDDNAVEHSQVREGSKDGAVGEISIEGRNQMDSQGSDCEICPSEGNPKIVPSEKEEIKFTKLPKTLEDVSRDVQPEVIQITAANKDKVKTSCTPAAMISDVPDLNSSACASTTVYQPFTDIQQVQLRAQIFVYGYLIQGTPPEETCMLTAFGDTDGGRTVWESTWRVSVEKFDSQKSPISGCETTQLHHSGARISEQVNRYNPIQNKAPSPHFGKGGHSTVSLSPLFNSASFPTPLWKMSPHSGVHSNMPRGVHLDFSQAAAPFYSYQSPQARPYMGNDAQWISESSSQTTFGAMVGPFQSPRFDSSAAIASTSALVTPVGDFSVPRSPFMQHVTPGVPPSSLGPSVSLTPSVQNEVKTKVSTPRSSKHTSASQKPRKTKKTAVLEETGALCVSANNNTESTVLSSQTKNNVCIPASLPSSANTPTRLCFGTSGSTSNILSPASFQVTSCGNTEQKITISEETCIKTEQAKLQAEDAAALAATAVKHSQNIWRQLSLQKDSMSTTEVEQKLASAAVAAAAAVAVAKAAAAAAKVAAEAAVQAKMLADDAQNSFKSGVKNTEISGDTENFATELTSASILMGKDNLPGNSSVIAATREAARKRVEAASAAAKRAENLDAIVRAAELAAEAVSQAGTIIAMGDPLPLTLSELVEAGPEGYWKRYCRSSGINAKSNAVNVGEKADLNATSGLNASSGQFGGQSSDNNEVQRVSHEEEKPSQDELPVLSEKDNIGNTFEKRSSNSSLGDENDVLGNLAGNPIEKGTLVEVAPDEDRLKGVWFSARVLDMKDNKAYVSYDSQHRDEGSGQLKEWIPIEFDGNRGPRIRIAHPIMTTKSKDTRKRGRDALTNYLWAVGDRVDAWIRNGWREGIVTEKSEEDEKKFTIHFPAGGDTSVVRAWNLRPSILWKDGQWTEWSRLRDDSAHSHEGDTPNEKRLKSTTFETNTLAKDALKTSKVPGNLPEEFRPSAFSAKEGVFSVGRIANTDVNKMTSTSLRKGWSGVIFGVPKPGKKRKFMEVSKHLVAGKSNKTGDGNDSNKFPKYLVPQLSRSSQGISKVDQKNMQGLESKPKPPRPLRSHNIQTRSTVEKDNSSSGADNGPLSNAQDSFNDDGNKLERNLLGSSSFSDGFVATDVSNAKPPSVEADIGVKGKLGPVGNKMAGIDERELRNPGTRTMLGAIEPRRSNRRIQPTSRLLEGLQSSLIVSKIPSVSHERSSRPPHRGISKGTTR